MKRNEKLARLRESAVQFVHALFDLLEERSVKTQAPRVAPSGTVPDEVAQQRARNALAKAGVQ